VSSQQKIGQELKLEEAQLVGLGSFCVVGFSCSGSQRNYNY